jgi:hypothetical protein
MNGAKPMLWIFGVTKTIHLLRLPALVPSQVAKAVNKTAADLAAWSISLAMKGIAPSRGFYGENLSGHRLEMAGKPMAQGWRFPV